MAPSPGAVGGPSPGHPDPVDPQRAGSKGVPGDPGYTTAIERESLRLTLDALDLELPHLAGWSGGGLALIAFAIEYPQRVRSLTLVEPAAYWILARLGERIDEVQESNAFVHGLFGREVSEDELATFLRLGGLAEQDGDVRSHPNWGRWVEHRTTLSWLSPLLDRPDLSIGDLSHITAPVLVTRGRRRQPSTAGSWTSSGSACRMPGWRSSRGITRPPHPTDRRLPGDAGGPFGARLRRLRVKEAAMAEPIVISRWRRKSAQPAAIHRMKWSAVTTSAISGRICSTEKACHSSDTLSQQSARTTTR